MTGTAGGETPVGIDYRPAGNAAFGIAGGGNAAAMSHNLLNR